LSLMIAVICMDTLQGKITGGFYHPYIQSPFEDGFIVDNAIMVSINER